MKTITLEYDGRNIVIKKLIEAIMAAGAKEKKGKQIRRELTKDEEREGFLYTSKVFASHALEKHL